MDPMLRRQPVYFKLTPVLYCMKEGWVEFRCVTEPNLGLLALL